MKLFNSSIKTSCPQESNETQKIKDTVIKCFVGSANWSPITIAWFERVLKKKNPYPWCLCYGTKIERNGPRSGGRRQIFNVLGWNIKIYIKTTLNMNYI